MMQNIFILFMALIAFQVTSATFPEGPPSTEAINNINLRKEHIQPCSYWYYDFNVHGYTCRSLGISVDVYQAYDVDRLLSALEQKMQQLDERVKKLEQVP